MTRDEVKKRYELAMFKEYAEQLIDGIYDDFESRTCENCSFRFEKFCEKGIMIGSREEIELDFGCNKWKSKDAN